MNVLNISKAGECYTHKNWFYKNLYLNCSIIYYIIDGNAYYKDENGTILFKKNHLYILPAKKNFTLYDDPKNQLLHTFIHATTLPTVNSLVEINVENNSVLQDILSLLRKYVNSNDYTLITNILNLLLSTVFSENKSEISTAFVIKNYIDNHLKDKITLNVLCADLAYSKSNLNRIFKKQYKVSPIKYYNDKRLTLSAKYLAEGKRSKDISVMLNYSTPSAFCNAFKMKYGLSPEKYIETLFDR